MTESLVRRFYENLFESGENFGARGWMCYEEATARDPSVSFIKLSFVLRLFEPLVVAVQNLDVELIGFTKVVQDSWDNQFVVVFADSEAVFSIS